MILVIIIGMDDSTGTCIPAVVVPYHSKTADTIKVEILEVEVLQIKLILSGSPDLE